MKTEVVLKDVGVGENNTEAQIALEYYLTHPKIRL
jgi:hypothetical protein